MTKFICLCNRSLSKLKPIYILSMLPNLHFLTKNQMGGEILLKQESFKKITIAKFSAFSLNDMRYMKKECKRARISPF